MLQQQAGAPGPGGPPPGPPEQEGSVQDRLLRKVEEIEQILAEDGSVDEQERVALERIRTELAKLVADRVSEQDSMLQGKVTPRAMRRA